MKDQACSGSYWALADELFVQMHPGVRLEDLGMDFDIQARIIVKLQYLLIILFLSMMYNEIIVSGLYVLYQ